MPQHIEPTNNGEVPGAIIDPKAYARARIEDFLSLTVGGILRRPYDEFGGGIVRYDAGAAHDRRTDTRNRRLASSMLGLEGAIRTICQVDPPKEMGESISAEREIIDGETGEAKKYWFRASRAGSDFGTFLHCNFDTPGIQDSRGEPIDEVQHVLVPQSHYLIEVLRHGDPHEPTFAAFETDFVTPDEWATEEKEWLENGGITLRDPNYDRAYRRADGTWSLDGPIRDDVYRRHLIKYYSLYSDSAPGIERYVHITQSLLTKLIDAVDGEHEVTFED